MVASVLVSRTTNATRDPSGRRRGATITLQLRIWWWWSLAAVGRLARRVARSNLQVFSWTGRHADALSDRLSAAAAVTTARSAVRRVPAYAEMLQHHLATRSATEAARSAQAWLTRLPVTTKRNYIDQWPLAGRCSGGRIPASGCELDESAGSTGMPYTWIRSHDELLEVHRTLALMARHLLPADSRQVIVVNAFSMGAWATGTNVAAALRAIGTVKSCGPDIDKALGTIALFGPEARYIVCGYPPFLRALLDAAAARDLDLSAVSLYGFVGGEGMTEAARARLERTFRRVWSAYGASDLDIGVASETPLSVWLRQQAALRPDLALALFGRTDRLPMVFQYDPGDYYIETVGSPDGRPELVVTVNRPMLSPRIRYNVGDEGGTIAYRAAMAACRAAGLDPGDAEPKPFRLPFLFVHGRSDQTLSFMGANLYPEDVAMGIGDHPDADRLGAFCMELADIDGGEVRPVIHIEVLAGYDGDLPSQLAASIRNRLQLASGDYRTALAETTAAGDIRVHLWQPGKGPFADNARRIKHRQVIPTAGGSPAGTGQSAGGLHV
jgi:phenylacetate-CoA ligase